jgi:hypothetical protein
MRLEHLKLAVADLRTNSADLRVNRGSVGRCPSFETRLRRSSAAILGLGTVLPGTDGAVAPLGSLSLR